MNKIYLLLLIPLALAVFALNGFGFIFKAGVPISCALIIACAIRKNSAAAKGAWLVIAGLLFSAAGDWFLSFKGDSLARFAAGIGLFFCAHAGYLAFALLNGRFNKTTIAVLLAVYLPFFYFVLLPVIEDSILLVSVILYLLISCLSVGAAFGIELGHKAKWAYILGLVLILFSDTVIAFHEFTSYQDLNFLILPTYYAAHLFITLALMNSRVDL